MPVPEPQWPDDYFELQEPPVDAALESLLAPEAPFALQDPFGADEWATGMPDEPPFDFDLPGNEFCIGGDEKTANDTYSRGVGDDDPPAHSLLDLSNSRFDV